MSASPSHSSINRLHTLLGAYSLVVILASVNRLTDLTTGYVLPNEFLRWVDFLNMLVLPLLLVIILYLVKKHVERAGSGHRWLMTLNIVFLVGIYLFAASYGDHEVTNYLHIRFCPDGVQSDLCRIIIFNDDEFSHWVFFIGFTIINASLLWAQIMFPTTADVGRRDILLLVVNGVFIAAGIFANLAFEVIGLDLYVIVLLAALSVILWWRYGKQPLVIYYTAAYVLGLIATLLYKQLGG